MKELKVGYYYLQTNSQIIFASFDDVDWVGPFSYFNRPFIVSWGMVQSEKDYNLLMTKFKQMS